MLQRFFLIWLLDEALHDMDQSNKCSKCFSICCVGCDLCVGLECSDQRIVVFLMVSPT